MTDPAAGLPPARRQVTVVAPVYNEQEVIAAFSARTRDVLATLRDRYASRILFVVDRCTDDTMTVLRGIAARDRTKKHHRRDSWGVFCNKINQSGFHYLSNKEC